MKLFWYDIKKTSQQAGSPVFAGSKKNYSTTFTGQGILLDGQSIAQGYATYWKMYKTNTDIQRCIEEKIQTTMKKGWELHRINKTDWKHTIAYDPTFSQALGNIDELKKMIIMALDIFADVFIRKRRNVRGQVIGYEVLDTREVSVITDADLTPVRYTYRRKTPRTVSMESFEPENIAHFKTGHNWDNPIFGYTVLSTLIFDALGDDEASKVNYYWYANDAVPSSLFVLKDTLSTDEKAQAIENIQDTLKGSHNAGKSMITDTVTDVKTIGTANRGNEDIEKRRYATEKICAGLGVPRSILGYVEGVNLSNSGDLFKKFIENTIQPLERMLEVIFTELSQDFSGYSFIINSDHIDQTEQKSKIARDNVASGIWTRNEAREYMDYDKLENTLADEITVPSTTQLLDNLLLGEPTVDVPTWITNV